MTTLWQTQAVPLDAPATFYCRKSTFLAFGLTLPDLNEQQCNIYVRSCHNQFCISRQSTDTVKVQLNQQSQQAVTLLKTLLNPSIELTMLLI